MKIRLRNLWLVVVLAGSPGWGFAADMGAESANSTANYVPAKLVYLTGNEAVWSSFPKCAAPGSETDELDLEITLSIQASRTDAQKAEAELDKNYNIKLMTGVISPDFSTKFPNTFAVLREANGDDGNITTMIKNENERLRPFVGHPTLVLPLFFVPDYSYPSGHASGMELQARLLGTLFPAQAEALLNRARQVADSRVVAGVHYTSDTEEGLMLGDLVFKELEADAKFTVDLAAAAEQDGIGPKNPPAAP
jgi:acid phosphatase (class A)